MIARRGRIKAVLTRFQGYIGSPECDINQIVLRRKKVEDAWDNFERVQGEIEELDSANGTNHSGIREEFENVYFEVIAKAEQMTNSLRQFSDTLRGHISALEALKQQPCDWGPLLAHIICTKLDAITLSEWETKSSKSEISKVADLILFLEARAQVLEAIESSRNISKIGDLVPGNKNNNQKNKINKNNSVSTSLVSMSEIKCYACDLSHTIYKCPSFLSLAVADRIKRVNELGLCKVCLRKHDVKRCLSRNNCYKCHKAHNTLLHLIIPQKYNEKKSNETSNQQTVSTSTSAHASGIDHENVILSTAIVRAIGKCSISILCRSLLDSGSQSNFITEEIVQALKLKKNKDDSSSKRYRFRNSTREFVRTRALRVPFW